MATTFYVDGTTSSATTSAAYTEQTPAFVLTKASATSQNNPQKFTTFTLTIAGATATESLSVTGTASTLATYGVTSSYSAGVLTLGSVTAGTVTDAAWNDILQHVQYNDTSDAPPTTRTINVVGTYSLGTIAGTDTINITRVNDAPTVSAPGTIQGLKNAATALSGITFADPDAGAAAVTASLTAAAGTFAATSGGGVTVSGSGTGALTLGGTIAAINSFIGNITYTPALDVTGTVNVTAGINDGANVGTGGAKTGSTTVTFNIGAANQAPTVAVAGAVTVTEDVASAVTGITFADVDAAAASVVATLTAPTGTLSGTSGGNVTVGGSGTGTLTLTGSVADINSFIAAGNAKFTTPLNSTASVTVVASINDGGATGTGGAQTGSANVTLNVTAVNDAPTVAVAGAVTVTEDVATAVTGITFADVDAAAASVVATLTAPTGTLSGTSGGNVTVGGSGTGTLTLTGSVADINSFIAAGNAKFTTPLNSTASVTVVASINDGGATGTGGAQTGSANVTLNVTAVNDAPTVAVAGAVTVTEDVATAVTGITFADVDAAAASVVATLTAPTGTLSGTSGGNVTVGGSGTGTMTLTGSVADINSFIAAGNAKFTTAANATASVTLAASINDGGATGTGGAQTGSANVTLNVTAVNDAPTVAVAGAVTVTEDVATAVSGITFADVDAAAASVVATLTAPTGTLSGTSGGNVTVGGSGTGTLTLTGSIADINSFIAAGNAKFTTAANATASVTLVASINDGGATGTGGAQAGSANVTLNVTAVNDAPTVAVAGAVTVTEDVATAVTGITFADVDAAAASVVATLTAPTGTLSGTSGGNVTVGGSGTGTLTLTGSVADINSFIAAGNAKFTTAANATASVTLVASINDGGATGTGGAQTGSANVTLNVTAVNDAPTVAVAGAVTVTEDVATAVTGITFADVDAAAASVVATLAAPTGTLSGTSGGNVTVGGSGTGTLTLTGSIADINSFIAAGNAKFTTAANATASVTLVASMNDGGNSGGAAQTGSANVTLNVTAVNDAPTVAVAGAVTVTEDVATAVAGITFADVDAAVASVVATLTAPTGTLSGTSGGNVTVGGSGTGTLTLTGSIADINSFIAAGNAKFTTAANATASVTLVASINDGGATGTGGAQTGSANVTLNVTAVNDAPTVTMASSANVTAGATNPLTGIVFQDVDASGAAVSATFNVDSGVLTASSSGGVTVTKLGGLTLTGSIADINAYVAAGKVGFAGTNANAVLTATIDDKGNTGSGGALTGSKQMTLNAVIDTSSPNDSGTPVPFDPPTPAPTPSGAGPTVDLGFASMVGVDLASPKASNPTVTLPDGRVVPNPLYEDAQATFALERDLAAGRITQKVFVDKLADLASDTVAVPTQVYQFFTGATPSKAGLAYLVNSPDSGPGPTNAQDLTDPYYAGFSESNRYINFAVNLGKGGEGSAAFLSSYGGLSFEAAVRKAYDVVIGNAKAQAAGVNLDAAVAYVVSQQAYLLALGGNDIGAKAAMVGYLIGQGMQSHIGNYYNAAHNFLIDSFDGKALFQVDLVGTYSNPVESI